MEPNWVKVYTTNTLFNAELLVSMLRSNQVDAVLLNKQDTMYQTLFPGYQEIYVHESQVEMAYALLEANGEVDNTENK
jgi:hypothetical protein